MRTLILLLLALGVEPVVAAEVYRWTDENGVVHFSDRPMEGAEVIRLPEAQTFSAPAPQRRTQRSDAGNQQPDQQGGAEYAQLSIIRPLSDQVLRNTGGIVEVIVNLEPALKRGHRLQIVLDGEPVETLTAGRTKTQLREVFRGQHTLIAEVRDSAGGVVDTSEAVKFTVQQTSIQNPSNPLAPSVPTPTPR